MTGCRAACLTILLSITCLLADPPIAEARLNRFVGAEYLLEPGQAVTGQLWTAASTAKVHGTVSGDLIVAANHLVVGGRIGGDLWSVSQLASVTGMVAGDLQMAGLDRQMVSGIVGGNALILTPVAAEVTSGTCVSGDVAIAAESIILTGDVSGRAYLVGKRVTIGGRIGGNVRLIADDVVLLPGTYIGGDVTYELSGGRELVVPDAVKLCGKLIPGPSQAPADRQEKRVVSFTQRLLSQIFFLGAAVLAGIVWVLVFPAGSAGAGEVWQSSLLRCLLVGLAVLILAPVLVLSALFSVIGLPLGLAAASIYILLVVFGKLVSAYGLGVLLLSKSQLRGNAGRVLPLITGLTIIYALALIPNLGVAVWTFCTGTGMGAMVIYWYRSERTLLAGSRGERLPF